MSITLFEDSYWQNFAPISLTKATFDIKIGAKSFFEEQNIIPETLLTREYLAAVTAERHARCNVNPTSIDSDTLFINGLIHPAAIDRDRLLKSSHTFAITTDSDKRLLIAKLNREGVEHLQERVAAGRTINVKNLRVEKLTKLQNHKTEGI